MSLPAPEAGRWQKRKGDGHVNFSLKAILNVPVPFSIPRFSAWPLHLLGQLPKYGFEFLPCEAQPISHERPVRRGHRLQ